jgi:hypothetical protein
MSFDTATAGGGLAALANGAGHFTPPGGELRTFSFTAKQDSSGASSGQAQLNARTSGVALHLTIDCLNVVGNIASMSGVISNVNAVAAGIGFAPGQQIWFPVIDNKGTDSPDQITLVFINVPAGSPGFPVCTDSDAIVDADLGAPPALNAIQGGNVTVH